MKHEQMSDLEKKLGHTNCEILVKEFLMNDHKKSSIVKNKIISSCV